MKDTNIVIIWITTEDWVGSMKGRHRLVEISLSKVTNITTKIPDKRLAKENIARQPRITNTSFLNLVSKGYNTTINLATDINSREKGEDREKFREK